MNPRPVFRAAMVGLAAALLPVLNASAISVTWSNTGTGNWNDGANWTPSAPVAGDAALINNGGTAVIDASMDMITGSLNIADTTGSSGNLRMTGGSLTFTTTDFRIGGGGNSALGGTGVFDQSGGSILMNAGNLNIGFGTTAVGTYKLSGGSLQLNSANIIAVGNRGVGTITQTDGTVYVRGNGRDNTITGLLNLGRNVATGSASGTVTLSGGTIAVAKVQFGNAVQTAGSPSSNTFNLQGTGKLLTDSITVVNTAATNSFNFTGGTLMAENIGISLTNNGGNLSPASIDFTLQGGATGSTINELPVAPIGTIIFVGNSSYTQTSAGTLSIDIAGPGSNDFVSIGSDPAIAAAASISGKISVSLLNGYEPALGSTFDILSADSITNNALIVGTTASGNVFAPSTVTGGDGREVLRLTVVPEPSAALLLTVASAVLSSRRFRRKTSM